MAPVSEVAGQADRAGPPGPPETVAVPSAEGVRRRRVWLAVAVAGINLLGFSGLVAEQATEWSTSWEPAALAWWVGGVTVVTGGLLVAAVAVTARWVPWPWLRIALAVLLAAVQALVRAQVLLSATTAPPGAHPERFAIWTTGMIGFCVALGAGFLVTALLAREDRERARSGPQSTDPELSGLARHRSRAQNRGGSLTLGRNDAGGGRLHLVLPFTPEQDLD